MSKKSDPFLNPDWINKTAEIFNSKVGALFERGDKQNINTRILICFDYGPDDSEPLPPADELIQALTLEQAEALVKHLSDEIQKLKDRPDLDHNLH